MTQTIVITSGKGGVGKTNISVNTAIELAKRNYRTCLFDADLGLANVNILLGIESEHTLEDYVFGDKRLDEIVLHTQFGIDLIPASSGIEKMADLDRGEISRLVASLSKIEGYDYFLIDTSSGISRGVMAFCLAGSETLLIITSEATSLTDAYALLKVMALHHYSGTVKILVNKSPSIPQAKETYLRFKGVVNRHLHIDIAPAGIILTDPNIEISVSRQEPLLSLFPGSIASQCIRALVANLLRDENNGQKEDDFGHFWQRYFDHALDLPDSGGLAMAATGQEALKSQAQEDATIQQPTRAAELPDTSEKNDPAPLTKTNPSQQPPRLINLISYENGIFQASNLLSPAQCLCNFLEVQARGELSKEMMLEIILSDPSLTVRALQIICKPGPCDSRAKRLTSRRQFGLELGADEMSQLLISSAMQRTMGRRLPPDTVKFVETFWHHSYYCALLAENMAGIISYPFPEEAFIAGLIHDIGRLLLQTDHPELYGQFATTFDHREGLLDMERQCFTASHAEIGARILRAWHLDPFLVSAVLYHCEPPERIHSAFDLVKIIYLAGRLAHVSKADSSDRRTEQLAESLFGFTPVQLRDLLAQSNEKIRGCADRLKITLAENGEENSSVDFQNHLHHQVLEYSLLQNMLPERTPEKHLFETVKTMFQVFHMLFGIRRAFCLVPDNRLSCLQVVGSADCLDRETWGDMQFSLKWPKSLIVDSFLSGELKTALDGEHSGILPLADRQVLHLLGTDGFVCLPMASRGKIKGLIVFGINKSHLEQIHSRRDRLEQFGVQAARTLSGLEAV